MSNTSYLTKILTADQIRKADHYTIEHRPIGSIDLMEKASRAFVSWFLQRFGVRDRIVVLCGVGNNGGDGLAIARLLSEHGCRVAVYCMGDKSKASPDFSTNYNRLVKVNAEPVWIQSEKNYPDLTEGHVVIDALFGSGLTRPLSGSYAECVGYVNEKPCMVIAVDIASGMYSDEHTHGGVIMRCDYTVSFQIPKLAFYLPQNHTYTGELSVVDIGLDADFIAAQPTRYFLLTRDFIATSLRKRAKYAHKGNMGHALLVAGSLGKMGAAVLSAKACLRSGAGLVTAAVPGCGVDILQGAVPEAMIWVSDGDKKLENCPPLNDYRTVGVGPGLGMAAETERVLKQILSGFEAPMVLDADALNIIAKNNWLSLIPAGSVLTPHPREFQRLMGSWENDYERLEKQVECSRRYGLVVVLKGANSSISDAEGNVYFNTTGNPGMATAGSGDVLSGIVTALLAQGYSSVDAARIGVYLHGLAGNLYTDSASEESLIAGDLITYLPKAFFTVKDRNG